MVFDIETGPLPEEQLRELYREPTLEEFAAKCDSRWKPETVEQKYKDSLAAGWQKFVDKAALDPLTGRVVAIGVLEADGDGNQKIEIIDCDGCDGCKCSEDEGLNRFWSIAADCLKAGCPMVGHNTHEFDLPFLVRRSWLLGQPFPMSVRSGRYWNDLFIDLMQVWGLGSRDYIGLDKLGTAMGVGGKVTEVEGVEVSGAEFHRLWRENRPAAEEYLRRDLQLPLKIARRLGVV